MRQSTSVDAWLRILRCVDPIEHARPCWRGAFDIITIVAKTPWRFPFVQSKAFSIRDLRSILTTTTVRFVLSNMHHGYSFEYRALVPTEKPITYMSSFLGTLRVRMKHCRRGGQQLSSSPLFGCIEHRPRIDEDEKTITPGFKIICFLLAFQSWYCFIL